MKELTFDDEEEMRLGLSTSLRTAVQNKFQQARSSSDLLFSDTHLTILRSRQGTPFQLRYCPALGQKPKNDVPDPAVSTNKEVQKPKVDPFANPSQELLISQFPTSQPTHVLVLNKYPVIHNHFILATKKNKPQTELLEAHDFGAAYDCISAWEEDSKKSQNRLFAFFNSGEHSGASQPHRHLQFLPVDDMVNGDAEPLGVKWRLLLEGMTAKAHHDLPLLYDPSLPFVHFSTPIETNPSEYVLHEKYLLLLRAALSVITPESHSLPSLPPMHSSPSQFTYNANIPLTVSETNHKTVLSYNLAMSSSMLAICPRQSEDATIPGMPEGKSGNVSINGTILAGTLMVKDEAEWNTLKQNPHGLDTILKTIGYPWPTAVGEEGEEPKL